MWTNTEERLVVTMKTTKGIRAMGWIAHWPKKRSGGFGAGWTARFEILTPSGTVIKHWAENRANVPMSTLKFRGPKQAENWIRETLSELFDIS